MNIDTDRSPEIEALVDQLTSFYVFPDIAEQVCDVLRLRLAEGAYRGQADDEAFAAAVTADLQSVNGDKHLRLLFSVDEIPDDGGTEVFDLDRYRAEAELAAHGFAKVERLPGNVGLLDIRQLFAAEVSGAAAVAAMNLVAGADALVIDLRRNGGGDPAMVALLCGYLFDESVHLNDLYFRPDDSTTQYWTQPFVPGPSFGGSKPVYVLTSADTFSGAEELSYNLQQLKRATLIGETTKGGAHPGSRYRVGPHLKSAVPSGRAINPVSGTNWEAVGVQPDVPVPADEAFEEAYRRALTHVLTLGSEGPRRPIAAAATEALSGL